MLMVNHYIIQENIEDNVTSSYHYINTHVIYPLLKQSFSAPESFRDDGTIVQVADLQDLYKVFERC